MSLLRRLPALGLLLCAGALGACSLWPTVPATPAVAEVAPQLRLAAIAAAAGADDRELAVQPLRDPQVEDLRRAAARALAAGETAEAAAALNQALLIVAGDPALLQERAEVALLQREYARAETLAQRAYGAGARVGPLCRRHWATIEQARLALGQAETAAEARARIDTCTVPGIQRM